MVPLEGEIPGRTVLFGMVPGDLPTLDGGEYAIRANRLLRLALDGFRAAVEGVLGRYGRDRVAIVLGSSNTGVDEAQRGYDRRLDGAGPGAMTYAHLELGVPAEFLASETGVTGPVWTVSTACSSGTKAFSSARRLMEMGVVDVAIVGGVDAKCRFALNGFHSLGALSSGLCRPLSPDRDGINLGEGVALFTLERGEGEVELGGVGETSDAYHSTAPDPEGCGAEAAMRAAMAAAGIRVEDVGYVNLHGTGTIANDAMEMRAVSRIFSIPPSDTEGAWTLPERPLIESTKNLTGHCLGAAGAVEAAICWLLMEGGYVRGAALSNSFAFGGSNACVALVPGGGAR